MDAIPYVLAFVVFPDEAFGSNSTGMSYFDLVTLATNSIPDQTVGSWWLLFGIEFRSRSSSCFSGSTGNPDRYLLEEPIR